jgi:hypothetical protein
VIGTDAPGQWRCPSRRGRDRWHAAIADELREAFESCLPQHRFTLGPNLRAFEEERTYCESYGVGVERDGRARARLRPRVGPGVRSSSPTPTSRRSLPSAVVRAGLVDVALRSADPAVAAPAPAPGHPASRMYGQCVDIDAIPRRARDPGAGRRPCPRARAGAAKPAGSRHGRSASTLEGDGCIRRRRILTTSDPTGRPRQRAYMGQGVTRAPDPGWGRPRLQAAFLRVKPAPEAGRRRRGARTELRGTPSSCRHAAPAATSTCTRPPDGRELGTSTRGDRHQVTVQRARPALPPARGVPPDARRRGHAAAATLSAHVRGADRREVERGMATRVLGVR